MRTRAARLWWLLLVLGACSWWDGERAAIRARLDELTAVLNASAEGPAAAVRAARIGAFFAEDAVVELGRGAAPIAGRDTIVAMAGRLEPRTIAFSVKLVDVNTHVSAGKDTADVNLTAEILRRSALTDQPSLDAREFAVTMKRQNDVWVIAHVTAVDTLKQ